MSNLRFLLVEDDPSAAMICRLALEENWSRRNITAEVAVCTNGLDAINYLEKCEQLPHLILTDVKMPLLDGLRLLKLLKEKERYRRIPVVMVSTSDDPGDIAIAFEGQCAGYLLKDADFEKFSADLETLQRYWEISQLP